jgi:hypothetical protein
MIKFGLTFCVFSMLLLGTSAAQDRPNPGKNNQVTLKYLGAAGWEITDGTTYILIDPYLSRINGISKSSPSTQPESDRPESFRVAFAAEAPHFC